MPEDEHTDYGTHDRDNKSITDDENPMDFQIDDDSGDDLGTNEGDYTGSDIDENDIDDGTETGEDEELPEDSSRALSQWASKLCVVCRRFLEGTVYTEGGYSCNKSSTYHPSKSSMRQSLQAGCPLCKKLSYSLDNYWVVPDDSWFIKCSVDHTEDDLIYGESERIVLHFYLFDDEGFQVDADNSPGFEYMTFHLAKSLGTCLGPAFFV
ncbi:hypothetical protein GQ607_004012 [Colletotrichum asianum]|uniref:Uncharacterized protein n=1 Tax=Colletotrichum asianum TaxID=702518 RepID=A0A8H3ZXQ0_9PEZI|nr:hypothetical protein GQ607_004012 [Colletotrichum asianum]